MTTSGHAHSVTSALAARPFVLLDGAVGTELAARGVDMHLALDDTDEHDDYWSGKALITGPDAVVQVHRDYLLAGCDVVTTNSFRINRAVIERLGVSESADTLLRRAVALAVEARDDIAPRALVGGSLGPIESCYSPERAPDDDTLARLHGATIDALIAGGVDLLLPETMNSVREAAVVAERAAAAGAPFMMSFCLRRSDGRLHSGEDLLRAAEAVLQFRPLAILVNHCHRDLVEPALHRLRRLLDGTGIWFGGRAHLEKVVHPAGAKHECSAAGYADYVSRWLHAGARVVGGCCGTSPVHIQALLQLRHLPLQYASDAPETL